MIDPDMSNLVKSAFPFGSILREETIGSLAGSSKLYVIFITPRSGSTWLTELAMNSGLLGAPQEWFNENWIHTEEIALGCRPPKVIGTADINEYVHEVVSSHRAANGVMGIQLSQYQTQCLIELLESPSRAATCMVPFYLCRRNLVAQAISLYRSRKSGLWHSYQDAPGLVAKFQSVEYDRAEIEKRANPFWQASCTSRRCSATAICLHTASSTKSSEKIPCECWLGCTPC